MSEQHTPGKLKVAEGTDRWSAVYDGYGSSATRGLAIEGGHIIALAVEHNANLFSDPDPMENARRLVACWNLLADVPTEEIEAAANYGASWGKTGLELAAVTAELDALRAENARLRAELEAVGAGGVQPLRAEAGWVLVPVERVHHWIVPDFGYLFPTEDAARRYLENIGADALPTACYTAPQQAAPQAQPAVEPAAWLPMDAAPKDGTLVRLLVEFEDHATEDGPGPHPTIGANTSENDKGPDEWQFAGWNWEHDCFTQGVGTPVGWLPMTQCVPAFKAPAQEGGEA